MTALYNDIQKKLDEYDSTQNNILVGIHDPIQKDVLVRQIIDSIRRINYVTILVRREWAVTRTNSHHNTFDPLMAAAWYVRNHNFEEALWLIFLYIHFGKNASTGWNLIQAVYGRLGASPIWNYANTSTNIDDFIDWLDDEQDEIKRHGKFCNHRKYQSLSATSRTGTGATIKSFIRIVPQLLPINTPAGNRGELFEHYYKIMGEVIGFGRLAKFDFLTMLGKMNILPIEPAHPYLQGATGPIAGAKKLYGFENREISITDLNALIADLGNYLGLYFVMQILEDSLCNWQKDTTNYQRFRG